MFTQAVTLFNKFELLWKKFVGFVNDWASAVFVTSNCVAAKLKENKRLSRNDLFP
jgi:hypothetical protein